MNRIGSNSYDRNMKSKCREFELYFKNSLNKETCYIEGVKTEAIFQDHSQSNNKDLSDDKYVILPNSVSCSVGNYITWRSQDWLVFTEEFKTIETHQQLKIKVVNENMKWIKNGKICNNGKGWGAYVQNQTLYTLGVSNAGHHISVINAKMMLYMQDNKETRQLGISDRLFIGRNVYKIMFADTVSRSGLINFLLEEDTIGSDDNKELLIANYYSKINKEEEPEKVVEREDPAKEGVKINGSDSMKISRTYTFTIDDGYKVTEWGVNTLETENPVVIMERDESKVTLKVNNDNRLIGNKIVLIANVDGVGYISKSIRITKRF